MAANNHDGLVLQVGEELRAAFRQGDVYLDLPTGKRPAWARPKWELGKISSLVLAAYIPTRTMFASTQVISDPDWHVPDAVVLFSGKRYVVDVCGWRDSAARSGRKIENVVAAARDDAIAGMALVHEPALRKGFTRSQSRDDALDRALDQLMDTFERIFGGRGSEEDTHSWLRLAMQAAKSDVVRWENVLEVEAKGDWKTQLRRHAEQCFEGGQLLVDQ